MKADILSNGKLVLVAESCTEDTAMFSWAKFIGLKPDYKPMMEMIDLSFYNRADAPGMDKVVKEEVKEDGGGGKEEKPKPKRKRRAKKASSKPDTGDAKDEPDNVKSVDTHAELLEEVRQCVLQYMGSGADKNERKARLGKIVAGYGKPKLGDYDTETLEKIKQDIVDLYAKEG
jgi:hypothetical protein